MTLTLSHARISFKCQFFKDRSTNVYSTGGYVTDIAYLDLSKASGKIYYDELLYIRWQNMSYLRELVGRLTTKSNHNG